VLAVVLAGHCQGTLLYFRAVGVPHQQLGSRLSGSVQAGPTSLAGIPQTMLHGGGELATQIATMRAIGIRDTPVAGY
jgi:hypothetical protein